MKKTKLLKLLGVSLLIGGLVACGGGSGGSQGGEGGGGENPPVDPAKDPSLNITEKSIKVGEEFTLSVNDVPEGEIPIWTQSGTAVSFVLESIIKADSAKVKGEEAGEARISVIVGSKTLTCNITVTDKEPDPGPGPGPQTGSVEIDFWHTFGQTIVDNLQPQIDKFVKLIKDNEGVDVTVNLVPCSNYATINENISSGLNTGNIPTLAVAYPDHIADYLEAEGTDAGKFMVNLDDYINSKEYGLGTEAYLGDAEGDSLDDIVPAYLEGGQSYVREGTYSFPYMKSTEAMLYNMDALTHVFEDYQPGGQKITNIKEYMNDLDWEEFMELCRQVIAHKSVINPALKTAAFYDSDSNMFISQLLQSGIGYSSIITNTAGKKVGHIDFAEGENRTKAEALVTKLKGWYDENSECHLFTTKGAFSTYGSDSFKNIESVFTIGSTGGSGYSLTSAFEIGVCKVPSMNAENPLYVTQGPDLCIMRNPKLSDKANEMKSLYSWKLLKYLTNAENNCAICLLGSEGYLPVRQSAYEQDLYLSFLESGEIQADIANLVVEDINGSYFNTACFPGSAQLRTEVGGIVTLALTDNTKTITSIFDTAIENAILKIK